MIVVVGVSHRAAPIEVREQLALSKSASSVFLKQLTTLHPVREAMVVSTCNRVEVIAAGESGAIQALELVAQHVKRQLSERAPEAARYLYQYVGADAVRHLFRVAASLDSLVLGEPQILGQLKQAFDAACRIGTVGSALHRAVPRALRAAKRVRTQTSIGAGQVSVPSVAVDLARQLFELSGKTALLIGSGEMGRSVARLLAGHGTAIQVLGRNPGTVQRVAAEVGGEPRTLDDLKASLTEADVVVTSTSAPDYVVTRHDVAGVRKSRRGRGLFFIDLAVPRDVDPGVADLEGTYLYNVDDFSKIVERSLAHRQRERDAAERIVASAADGYERWAEAEQVTPLIKALRRRFSDVMQAELERSLRGRLKGLGEAEQDALRKMLDASLNKMLHEPTQALRSLAGERSRDKSAELLVESAAETLRVLFSLEQEADTDASTSGAEESGQSEQAIGPDSGPLLRDAAGDAATGGSR